MYAPKQESQQKEKQTESGRLDLNGAAHIPDVYFQQNGPTQNGREPANIKPFGIMEIEMLTLIFLCLINKFLYDIGYLPSNVT